MITRIYELHINGSIYITQVVVESGNSIFGTMYQEQMVFATISYIYNSLN